MQVPNSDGVTIKKVVPEENRVFLSNDREIKYNFLVLNEGKRAQNKLTFVRI